MGGGPSDRGPARGSGSRIHEVDGTRPESIPEARSSARSGLGTGWPSRWLSPGMQLQKSSATRPGAFNEQGDRGASSPGPAGEAGATSAFTIVATSTARSRSGAATVAVIVPRRCLLG